MDDLAFDPFAGPPSEPMCSEPDGVHMCRYGRICSAPRQAEQDAAGLRGPACTQYARFTAFDKAFSAPFMGSAT